MPRCVRFDLVLEIAAVLSILMPCIAAIVLVSHVFDQTLAQASMIVCCVLCIINILIASLCGAVKFKYDNYAFNICAYLLICSLLICMLLITGQCIIAFLGLFSKFID